MMDLFTQKKNCDGLADVCAYPIRKQMESDSTGRRPEFKLSAIQFTKLFVYQGGGGREH